MEGSVGTALRNARLQKKITIEEASRVTKIRPDRIKDLERDEYTRFPSLAYARSFLILYAKYLQIDVSRYQTMDVGNPAGVGDYQYLQNEAGVDSLRFTRPDAAPPKPILFRALMIFLAAVAIGAISAYIVLLINRLPSVDDLIKKHQKDDRSVLATPGPSGSPIRVLKAIPVPPKTGTAAGPGPAVSPAQAPSFSGTVPVPVVPPLNGGTSVLPAIPVPQTTGSSADQVPPTADNPVLPEVTPAPLLGGTSALSGIPIPGVTAPAVTGTDTSIFIPPLVTGTTPETTGSTAAQPTATPTPEPPLHEVRIRVTKRAFVTVRKDDPEADPVFSGKLSSSSAPLVFTGHRFWIKTRDSKDRQSLKVTSDGDPVKPGASGVKIP